MGGCFNAIMKLHSLNHLCELSKSSQASPGFLGTLPQLEHHVEHAVTRETPLGPRGSMPNRPKG